MLGFVSRSQLTFDELLNRGEIESLQIVRRTLVKTEAPRRFVEPAHIRAT
jgi:hypothetical protein